MDRLTVNVCGRITEIEVPIAVVRKALQLISTARFTGACKYVRKETGLGLAEVKAVCDEIRKDALKSPYLCIGCNKIPALIQEYVVCARNDDITPDEYVRREEGTLNPDNGHFWCTECYSEVGMPSGKAP
jgi:hypothetical protein